MSSCEQCGKSYASQYTLDRHRQNHSGRSQHTCSICQVTYFRRDLLARHQKIHKRSRTNDATEASAAASTSPPLSRRRRHTACLRCAEQRKKCSGGDPCANCDRAGCRCVFPSARARISRALGDENGDATGDCQNNASSVAIQHISKTAGPANCFSDLPTCREVDEPAQIQDSQLLELSPDDPLSLYTTSQSADTFAPNIYDLDSWVWLHENLYLQPDHQPVTSVDVISYPTLPPTLPQTSLLSPEPPSVQSAIQSSNNAPGCPRGDTTPDEHQHLIEKLVSYATMLNLPVSPGSDHSDYWLSMSEQIRDVFSIGLSTSQHVLQCFIDLYLQHFWPLWPLVAQHNLSVDQLHPLLYLVLASIGAMYGDAGSVRFGRLLHNKVRTYLTVAFELDDNDVDYTWLAQARLYTQVTALYFGQPKAFTYAQHLGALLVAQARRIELFSAEHANRAYQSFVSLRDKGQSPRRLDIWLQLETRRRLAFGIFRVDTYTSVLMDTRPLLSLDEIDLSFPYCDSVWRAVGMPVDACLYIIDHDRTPSRHLRASDIYGIALDPEETLPTLDPISHELLLFGLQRSLGRFAFDNSARERLNMCRSSSPSNRTPSQASGLSSVDATSQHRPTESTQLSITQRRMRRLETEFKSMSQAQRKWEDALPVVKNLAVGLSDRGSLMSGLVLFHLGFLRLHAPIPKLHQLQYRLTEKCTIDPSLLAFIAKWIDSPNARLAAHRSCDLFALVAGEASQEAPDRIKFNLLAFIALHHASIILWSYASACDGGLGSVDPVSHDAPNSTNSSAAGAATKALYLTGGFKSTAIEVRRCNTEAIVDVFVDLFNRISPGKWSSFAEAAGSLARLEFPGVAGSLARHESPEAGVLCELSTPSW